MKISIAVLALLLLTGPAQGQGTFLGAITGATDSQVAGEICDLAHPGTAPAIKLFFHGLNVEEQPVGVEYPVNQNPGFGFQIPTDPQVHDYAQLNGAQMVDLMAQDATGRWVVVDSRLVASDGSGPTSIGPAPAPPVLMSGPPPPPPPVGTLPVPEALAGRADQIVQRFGLVGIYGADTTPDNLDVLERALTYYPLNAVAGLSVDFEPGLKAEHPAWVAAYWDYSGQITVLDRTVYRALMVHEIAHHVTLLVDTGFGQALAQGLGWTPDPATQDGTAFVGDQGYSGNAVTAASHPSDYSYTNIREDLAEVVMMYLVGAGDATSDGYPPLSSYSCPPPAAQALSGRLGAGAPDGLSGQGAL